MNEKLKLSIITENETLENILVILNHYGHGYTFEFLKEKCWVYAACTEELEGVCVFQWMDKRTVNLHVSTFNNNYNWVKYYKEVIVPEISKHADYQMILLEDSKKSLLRLFKGYGFNFEWDDDIKRHKSLHKLSV